MTTSPTESPRAFQKGDRVKCVSATGSDGLLQEGGVYVVTSLRADAEGDVYLAGLESSWLASRFILAQPKPSVEECACCDAPAKWTGSFSGLRLCDNHFHNAVGPTNQRLAQEKAARRTPEPAAEGSAVQEGPSPVKADKAKLVRGEWDGGRKWDRDAVGNGLDAATYQQLSTLDRRIAAARADLDSSSAKRRAALERRYGGRPGIDDWDNGDERLVP